MIIFTLKYIMDKTALMVVVKAVSLESAKQVLKDVFIAPAEFESVLSQVEDKPVEMPIAIGSIPWR